MTSLLLFYNTYREISLQYIVQWSGENQPFWFTYLVIFLIIVAICLTKWLKQRRNCGGLCVDTDIRARFSNLCLWEVRIVKMTLKLRHDLKHGREPWERRKYHRYKKGHSYLWWWRHDTRSVTSILWYVCAQKAVKDGHWHSSFFHFCLAQTLSSSWTCSTDMLTGLCISIKPLWKHP